MEKLSHGKNNDLGMQPWLNSNSWNCPHLEFLRVAFLNQASPVYLLVFLFQNNLNVESASTSETSFPPSKEAPGEHSDHQAGHQPFPRQQFQQEAGHPSLQRDGPRSFLLDLPNFPDLSKADINGQNPNIQVMLGN